MSLQEQIDHPNHQQSALHSLLYMHHCVANKGLGARGIFLHLIIIGFINKKPEKKKKLFLSNSRTNDKLHVILYILQYPPLSSWQCLKECTVWLLLLYMFIKRQKK